MQNSVVVFTFFVLDGKYLICTNLVHKIRIVISSWNLVPRLIQICRIQWRPSIFLLRPEILFLGKFGPKNEDWRFKLKFGTQNNSNMQNSIMVFTFSVFERKHPFWLCLVQKIEIANLSWNLVPTIIRICRIQWWCSLFLF